MVVHKYKVGDKVKFKSKFIRPTCGLVQRAGTVAVITGIALSYSNKPHYKINGVDNEVFTETVFAGKVD